MLWIYRGIAASLIEAVYGREQMFRRMDFFTVLDIVAVGCSPQRMCRFCVRADIGTRGYRQDFSSRLIQTSPLFQLYKLLSLLTFLMRQQQRPPSSPLSEVYPAAKSQCHQNREKYSCLAIVSPSSHTLTALHDIPTALPRQSGMHTLAKAFPEG